jgi:acyl-CoA thioesterase-1
MKTATTSETQVRFLKAVSPVLLFALPLLLAGCGGREDVEVESDESTVYREQPETAEQYRILFLGNSITAGYGIDPGKAFPALIQERLDEEGLPFVAVNAGQSGETTAGGLRRLDWLLRQPVDVLVLELGANDGLRGLPVGGTRANLQAIISRTREAHPDVRIVLAGMQLPPNLGRSYTRRFRNLFFEVAEEEGAALIPFILEDVAGVSRLNQADGIHPTAAGHRIIADTVWETLYPILTELTAEVGA